MKGGMKVSICIVLEGGGMRGLYTAGVLDKMIDEGIKANGMLTVSSGALFGINYASGQRGRTLRYNKRYIQDKRYISIRSWIKTGDIVNKEFAYYSVPFMLDVFDEKAFQQSGIDFYATLTNVETGCPEYSLITSGYDQIETLRASGSMPFVSNFVEINGKYYLDGGISDSVPIRKAISLGYDKMIVVLTRPAGYKKNRPSKAIIDYYYRQYPNLAKALKNRYKKYNQILEEVHQKETTGEIFVIRPTEKISIKRLERNPSKLQEMYNLGYKDATDKMRNLKKYLIL